MWSEAPAYRMAAVPGARAAVPANAVAADAPLSKATDMFLIHCPHPLEAFREVLKAHPSIGRVHAFALGEHGERFGRELLKEAYIRLLQFGELPEERAARALAKAVPGMGPEFAKLSLRIFFELQFLQQGKDPGTIRVVAQPARRDLAESGMFRLAERAAAEKRIWRALPAEELKRRLFGGGGQDEQKTEAIG